MLFRLFCLGLVRVFGALTLLSRGDVVKTAEVLVLRLWVPKTRSCGSGGLLIFVYYSVNGAVVAGSEVVEVGDRGYERGERGRARERAVGPVLVVVPLVFGEDPSEVGNVPDQGAVEQFPTARADPPLHDRVHARHPDA